jgi:SAM-dependent methyltransferase
MFVANSPDHSTMKEIARQYWDEIAKRSAADARDAVLCGFRSEADFDAAGRDDARSLILPFLSADSVVLDVGCGVGRLAKWVSPHCRRLIALDISKEMLGRARVRLASSSNVTFRKLALNLRFPVPDRWVDFAYFYHVSEHMEREDAFRILSEIRRCLRTSGSALVQFSLITHADNQVEFRRWARAGDEEGVRSRFYTEEEASSLLGMANLHPQIRFYIPGEFAVVVTKRDNRALGAMPMVTLRPGDLP